MYASSPTSSRRRGTRRLHPAVFLLVALAGLLVADRLGALILSQIVKRSDFRISKVYAGAAKADVLLLGNSVGNAMALPPELAKALDHSVFSIAYHGMDAQTQQVIVEDLIERNEAPRVAVMELRPVTTELVLAPMFSPYGDFSPRLTKLIRQVDDTYIPWRSLSKIYGYNCDTLFTILQKVVDRDDQATGPSNGHISEARKQKWLRTKQKLTVLPAQLEAFKETALALKAAGTHVIILSAPKNPVTLEKGPWAKELADAVRAGMPADIPVVDASEIISDDASYEDPFHLNAHGRTAFLPFLVKIIRDAGL